VANKDVIGASDQPFEMLVERSKIREFARATKSQNAAYLDDPHPVSEPTFLVNMTFWTPPGKSVYGKVGLDMRRVLHGGQEFIFHGPPPRAGTKLTAQTRIEDIYEKEGKRGGTMTFVVGVTEFRDEQGNLVAESRGTTIETGRAPEKK
jgi:MaoC dehydratase-like protein